MKTSWFLILILLASVVNAECREDFKITPGACLGKVCIAMPARDVEKKLGLPAKSVSIRGLRLSIWKGSGFYRVFVVYKNGRVLEMHTNSPAFSICLPEGTISTRSSYSAVTRAFKDGKNDSYQVFSSGKQKLDYVVMSAGVTFTFAGDEDGALTRIVVHKIGFEKQIGYSEGDDAYWSLE